MTTEGDQTRAIVQQFAHLYTEYCEEKNLGPHESKTVKQFIEWCIEVQLGTQWVEHFSEIIE